MQKKSSQMTFSSWQKAARVFSGLIVSLVLLEAGLRLGGFAFRSMQEYGNLRSMEQKGAYRILCIGESTTQGQYPKPLERILNQRNIGVRFSVIDKGRGSQNTFTLLDEIGSNLAEYRPDMVVAMMGNNDQGVRYYQDIPESDTWLFRHCRVYRFGRILFMHILKKIKREDMDGLNRSDPGMKAKPAGAGIVTKKTALANGIPEEKAAKPALRGAGGRPGPRSPALKSGLSVAEKSLEKAQKPDSENDNDPFELGKHYQNQDELVQAENSLRKTIELDPKNDNAYVGLGWFYRRQRQFSQAEDSFKKAIEINPKNDNAYAKLGEGYREQGAFSRSEDLFRKAIEINPENNIALFGLLELYREQGKFHEAEDLFKKAIEINPRSARTLGVMASLYEEMGKPELAKEYAEKARRCGSEDNAAVTVHNYRKLKEILDRKGVKLVCVQYPMRNVESLKRIFDQDKSVIFVDNESLFKKAVRKGSYKEYFRDMFAGDFGHCTPKGNELLAQNIADVILREVFSK